MPSPYKLETVIDLLDKHRRRATYGAVAAMMGVLPRSVMRGLPREPRYSWVVSVESGRPSEYEDDQIHPDLEAHPVVLTTLDELLAWLDTVARKGDRL